MSYIKLFPPELRTASIVPRWSIVWTLNKDFVANHSYFVTIYARQIAKIIGWKGSIEDLMVYALYHDLDELITGDVVSPVKKAIIDPEVSEVYVDGKMSVSMPQIRHDMIEAAEKPGIKAIVKAADRLDALLFLITERRLGNSIVEPRITDAANLFKESWWDLPLRDPETHSPTRSLSELYYGVMQEEIRRHEHGGGFGV